MKKNRGKLQFSIFWIFFAPLEAKMMNNDENMIKQWKHDKNGKNSRKIAIFHFLEKFCTTGSKNDEKWLKNDKKWYTNEKTNEKNEENCNFPFFGKFLHHWKQKWWKMIKKW